MLAQYSRPATIDVVSRSGSNEFHGALFETFRDNAAGLLLRTDRRALRRDFRNIDTFKTRVVLVEAGPRVLAGFPEDLSAYAQRSLEEIGVEVVLGQPVTECAIDGVVYGGNKLEARTIVWAAGVRASRAAEWLNAPADRAYRLKVEPDLTVPGHPDIFAVGDTVTIAIAAPAPPAPAEVQHA